MTKQQIEAFKKITPGPWKQRKISITSNHAYFEIWSESGDSHEVVETVLRHTQREPEYLTQNETDAVAIASLPDLLAEREKMIAALKAAQSVMGWAEDGAHISLVDEAADKVDAVIEAIDEVLAEAEGGE